MPTGRSSCGWRLIRAPSRRTCSGDGSPLTQQRVADAAAALQQALASGGDPPPGAVVLRALIAAAIGRTDEAEPTLTQAFDAGGPPDRLVDEALAKLRIETFDLSRAATVLDRWVRDFPSDPKPHLWRAEIHGRTGGDSGAVANDYRAALARDPNLTDARLKLAEELSRQHLSAGALAEFATYLARNPRDAPAHLGAARALAELGDLTESARQLDQAAALAPANPEVARAQADAASQRGDWTAMLAALDRAVAVDPHDLTTRYQRGVALAQLGRADEARAEQALAARLRADLARLNEARGRLLKEPHDRASQLVIADWMFAHAHTAEGVRWAEKILREWPRRPRRVSAPDRPLWAVGRPGIGQFLPPPRRALSFENLQRLGQTKFFRKQQISIASLGLRG